MPDCDAHQEDQRGDDPVVVGRKGQRVVVGQHQEDNRQRQVVVVGRTQLGDLAVLRIGGVTGFEIGDHDPLVRHNDEEHIGGHDCGSERTEVEKHCAAGEDLVIGVAHRDQQDEQQHHQHRRAVTEL